MYKVNKVISSIKLWFFVPLIIGLIGTVSVFAAESNISDLTGGEPDKSVDFVSANAVCPTDLVSYWKLNEVGSPTIFKDNQEANDATCSGDLCPLPASGRISGAQDFDGTDDQILSANASNPSSEITVMAWINPDALAGGDKGIAFKEGAFLLELESDTSFSPDFSVLVDGGTLVEYEPSGYPVPTGVWSHLAGTYDGTDLLVYLNGSQIPGKVTYVSTIDSSTTPYMMGRSFVGIEERFFDGKIDEVAVFNKALTPAEIKAIYDDGVLSNPLCNGSPTVISPGDQVNIEGDTINVQIDASDPDGDDLTYSIGGDGLPGGLTINANTGLISGIIDSIAAAGSPYDLSVIVTDDGSPNLSDSQNFTWTVSEIYLSTFLPIAVR